MEKITKKEFIELLTNNKSVFLGAVNNRPTEVHNLINNSVADYTPTDEDERRTVVRKQTNALQFSNGSWIYFDMHGEKTYYRNGNVIYQQIKYDYSQDFSCSMNGIVFSAVVYYIEF